MRYRLSLGAASGTLMPDAEGPDTVDADPATMITAAETLTSIAHELHEGFAAMSTDIEGTVSDHWSGAAANDYLARWSAVRNHGGLVVDRLESLIDGLTISRVEYQSTESANAFSIRTLNLD
ncbi:hypothetical protein E5720_16675 [Rhodococcus sp. PAMC28707]|nr:hypothetical protein E5769_18845 [Rhodococcus sp. PAMC28705]QCB59883.1 hypothetical protein E5720_16675 [Rhodococcus sp. PAMC28707]